MLAWMPCLQEAEEKEKIQRGIATLTEKLQKITGSAVRHFNAVDGVFRELCLVSKSVSKKAMCTQRAVSTGLYYCSQ
mgnify:CR=1 FL=1